METGKFGTVSKSSGELVSGGPFDVLGMGYGGARRWRRNGSTGRFRFPFDRPATGRESRSHAPE
ncbi:hypothetical protein GCM10023184_31770 [Flaviaesturariibacter amylovorans]|uniref:Uncharacterized protein n=1 Tax=Flaviaesturariibacter amylovorans TaxID=1084520 RepID=A0ABP8H9Y5_9BACT